MARTDGSDAGSGTGPGPAPRPRAVIDRIYDLKQQKGWSWTQLGDAARAVAISRGLGDLTLNVNRFSLWYKHGRGEPTLTQCECICAALGVPLAAISADADAAGPGGVGPGTVPAAPAWQVHLYRAVARFGAAARRVERAAERFARDERDGDGEGEGGGGGGESPGEPDAPANGPGGHDVEVRPITRPPGKRRRGAGGGA